MGLWDFALRFYADPAVQRACLEIQDRHGADVTIVLYLLWRAGAGRALDTAGVAAADAAVEPWRTAVVRPLREVRRAMKQIRLIDDPQAQEALRGKIKTAELEAERRALDRLERLAAPPGRTAEPRPAAAASLAAYAGHLGVGLPDELLSVFIDRLAAVTA